MRNEYPIEAFLMMHSKMIFFQQIRIGSKGSGLGHYMRGHKQSKSGNGKNLKTLLRDLCTYTYRASINYSHTQYDCTIVHVQRAPVFCSSSCCRGLGIYQRKASAALAGSDIKLVKRGG